MKNKFQDHQKVSNASVRIMLSYDYCHFEICLGIDEQIELSQVDDLRKCAQRLADKAIDQYKTAKKENDRRGGIIYDIEQLESKVSTIKKVFPKNSWNPQQKAFIKAYDDLQSQLIRQYNYQDDWE